MRPDDEALSVARNDSFLLSGTVQLTHTLTVTTHTHPMLPTALAHSSSATSIAISLDSLSSLLPLA